MPLQTWEIWYPKAASTGLPFARGLLDATNVILAHAVPDILTVEIRDESGTRVALTADLERTLQSPICRLEFNGGAVSREDIWPQDTDLGLPILLPGGEVGILKSWWNADDRKEWRWQIELHNSIR
jgi:hypothetical protein